MSFDLFTTEAQILARLAPIAGGIPIAGTFDAPDLTDGVALPVAAQILFSKFSPVDQVGSSAEHHPRWSFDLYVDTGRATPAHKAAAANFFSSALQALVGWQVSDGNETLIADGQDSGFDGRLIRISFGFIIPVFLAGN